MEKTLNIGWGRRSINPGKPVAITGQFYLRVSQGELQPVTANALAIENGDDAVIFASADLVSCGMMLPIVREKLRALAPDLPVEKLILSATHTHSGPSCVKLKDFPNPVECLQGDEAAEFIASRIAEAVAEAWKSRAPGKVAYGYGFAATGLSRRVVYLDDVSKRPGADQRAGFSVNGHAKMYGNTNDPMFSHFEAGTDSFINLLYTFDAADKLTGALINVPCPAQTNGHAWLLHPGFWHQVRRNLRAKYGDIGILPQCAGAGDLVPHQVYYRAAETRRYRLKYPEQFAELTNHPPYTPPGAFETEAEQKTRQAADVLDMLRAEDIGSRIAAAFDEVLAWAGKEKFAAPELRHEVKTVALERRLFPEAVYKVEKANLDKFEAEPWRTDGEPCAVMRSNSTLAARRARCRRVVDAYEAEHPQTTLDVAVHAVRIGDVAFASNRFELFMDYMHRIQARSPFVQTFIVQLTADNGMTGGSYLATERAVANKGYSASPYCNQVSPTGGQQLVDDTVEMLKALHE